MTETPSAATPPLAVTCGEPAGIGPDLILSLAARDALPPLVAIGSHEALAARARDLGLELRLETTTDTPAPAQGPGALAVLDVATARPVVAGRTDPANARHVLSTLETAVDGCLEGRFSAMVTGPVHKGVINDAGIPFSGHTEFLAERCRGARPVMMLACPGLRVALATTHLPLRQVADAISRDGLEEILRILNRELQQRFGCPRPHILVCGLNPHAGEGGHLGREEIDIITPVLEALGREGLELEGPLPADTLFTPRHLADADAVLAMYHDQGLPVLKHAGFGQAVNITLGLPLIRTSVDHGTALDLAATGRAETGSLEEAIRTAAEMADHAHNTGTA